MTALKKDVNLTNDQTNTYKNAVQEIADENTAAVANLFKQKETEINTV